MYADVERVRFDAARHFLRVIQQQGRVLMAAETNEQVAILLHHIQALAADLIGPGGTSRADNGFALTMAGSDIAVGPGHYWVAGRLCEVEPGSAVSYLRQPDYDAPPVPLTGTHVVYLDVWERHVSAAEDPGLVEVALAGPDSCTRTKQVWQIKIRPDVANATPNSVRNKWASIEDALGRLAVGGRLSAAVGQVPRATTPCLAAPTSGYTRGENQLLRVEVHCGGPLTENPTVKWAWDNASVAHRVRQVSGSTVVLAAPPRDARSGLAKGTRVELQSDIQVRDGRPGVLTTVQGVEDDGDDYRVILAADPDCEFKEDERDERERPRWALLRRWDHTGTKLMSRLSCGPKCSASAVRRGSPEVARAACTAAARGPGLRIGGSLMLPPRWTGSVGPRTSWRR